MGKHIFVTFQYIIPQHFISKLIGKLANSKNPRLKNFLISYFLKFYEINMEEALEQDISKFDTFNAFFIRRLKPEKRSICKKEQSIVCPVDGEISQIGSIKENKVFQAKGRTFDLFKFLGGDENLCEEFQNGSFSTIYLSPKDYHRVHVPFSGTLRSMCYIPGKLFSVNHATVDSVDNLFDKNERLVTIFDTTNGPMAIILVGAMIVAGIHAVWYEKDFKGQRKIKKINYPKSGAKSVTLQKGEELGHFELGSTVVICFPDGKMKWEKQLKSGSDVQMGQMLGTF